MHSSFGAKLHGACCIALPPAAMLEVFAAIDGELAEARLDAQRAATDRTSLVLCAAARSANDEPISKRRRSVAELEVPYM